MAQRRLLVACCHRGLAAGRGAGSRLENANAPSVIKINTSSAPARNGAPSAPPRTSGDALTATATKAASAGTAASQALGVPFARSRSPTSTSRHAAIAAPSNTATPTMPNAAPPSPRWCVLSCRIAPRTPSATAEKHYKVRPLDLLRMWHTKIEAWMLEQAGIAFESAQPGLRVVSAA